MTNHIIAYEGLTISLALMTEEYVDAFMPWMNWRIDIHGTMARPPYYREHGLKWIEHLRENKGKNEVFAVLVHENTAEARQYHYIGHMGLHQIDPVNGHAVSGSVFGAQASQGKGYGTEAKLLLLRHAFMVLGMRKVCSEVKGFNSKSLGHLLKCGYKIIGRHKNHNFHEGSFVDNILLECFREDWQPIWDHYKETEQLPRLTSEQRELVQKETNQN